MKKLLFTLTFLLTTIANNAQILIDGIYYNLNDEDKTASVTYGSNKYTGDITIPLSISYNGESYSVTSIGNKAFSLNSNLSSVIIPNSVRTIGRFAFEYSGITSITIPCALIIKESAFLHCSKLESVNLGDNLKTIEQNVFVCCSNLKSIYLPNSLTSIGDNAFSGCTNLETINIPIKLNEICMGTFSGCSSLKSIAFPDSINKIGVSAFEGCMGLTSIIISDNLTYIDELAFAGCSNLSSVTFGENVKSIGEDAFFECSSLTSISIPNSVISIGRGAFGECVNLSSVTLGENVKSIEDGVFCGCSNLVSVIIPNSVEIIGNEAFSGCNSLTSIIIPDNIRSLGTNAFSGCANLSSVTLGGGLKNIGVNCFSECQSLPVKNNIRYADWYLVEAVDKSITTAIICDNTLIVGCGAFRSCSNLISIFFPKSLKKIEQNAFYGCTSLTKVTLPDGIEEIGEWSFSGCLNISEIEIPKSVLYIGDNAFYKCSNLPIVDNIRYADSYLVEMIDKNVESTKIKEGTKFIGSSAFMDSRKLISFEVPKDVIQIGGNAFRNCTNLKIISMPNNLLEIGGSAFNGCSNLSTISLPNTVEHIGYYAFKDCINLRSISIPSSVKQIDDFTFSGCSNLCSINLPNSIKSICSGLFENCTKLVNLDIPESVLHIGNGAFKGCRSLSSITIPNSVNNIEWDAFKDCIELRTITISDQIRVIERGVFSGCANLETIILPDSLTCIGYESFLNCTKMESIGIPNSVTIIESSAFKGCSSLSSIIIPNNVSRISSNTFEYCTGLQSIVIPGNVSSIDNNAFDGCAGLYKITVINSMPANIFKNTFPNRKQIILYVPKGSKSTYLAEQYWNEFKEIKEWFNIIFEDMNVKNICVKNWDLNGDGELGTPEAAAVITLDSVFKNSKIISFNELLYFSNLNGLEDEAFSNSTLKDITLPESLMLIGKKAFLDCKFLEEIHIPYGISYIGQNAFSGCSAMKSITVDETNGFFCDIDGVLFSKDKATLLQYPAAKTTDYTVPDGTKVLGRDAFYMSMLKSVSLPKTLKELGYNLFCKSTKLIEVIIPEGVTSIHDNAFYGCKNLKEIHIPGSTVFMGEDICNGCDALKDVYYHSTKPLPVNKNFFTTTTYNNATLHVMTFTLDTVKKLEGWKYFKHFETDVKGYLVMSNGLILNYGESVYMSFDLSNSGDIDGIQFDMLLPDGFSIDTEIDGKYAVSTTNRTRNFNISCALIGTNVYRFVLFTNSRAIINSGEGAIVNIKVNSHQPAKSGDYTIIFNNVFISTVEGNESVNVNVDGFTAPLTLLEISNIPGDVDGNFTVDVTDVMIIVDYILNRPCSKFIFANADFDENNIVNVTDAMNVVNIILHKSNARISPMAMLLDRELLRLGTSETGCQLHTAFDSPNITALQMEITLPEGCRLNNVSLTGKAARSHMVKTYQLYDRTYNVVVFSIKGSTLDTDAPFLQIDLEGNGGLVKIENILCTDTNHESLTSPNLSAEVTGINIVTTDDNSDSPIYNLSGQRLAKPRKGINITNGKKMVVK